MPAQEIVLPKSSKSFISRSLPYVMFFVFCALSFVAYWYFDMQKNATANRWVEQRIVDQVNQIGERLDRDVAEQHCVLEQRLRVLIYQAEHSLENI